MTARRLAVTALLACLAWGDGAWGETLPPQSRLYAELIPHFRAFQHDLARLVVQERRRVDAARDVLVVEATARVMDPPAPSVEEQMRQHAFGVFVIDRATSRRRFTVDVFPTGRRLDYVVKIRDLTPERLVIAREGGTYGDVHGLVTYFWDLAAGTVPERLVHEHFAIADVVEHDGAVWAVGSDGTRGGVVRLGAPGTTPVAEVLASVGGQPVPPIHEVRVERDALVLLGATTRLVRRGGRWEASPNPEAARFRQRGMVAGAAFGVPAVSFWVPEALVRRHVIAAGARTFLVWASAIAANAQGGPAGAGLWEIDGGARFHAMPAPAYETFQKLRPRRVADGYTRTDTRLETEIGPIQVDGRRIWFGTTFYDGEGTSGVGGIGSFDVDTRQWQLVHPRAVADWSSSAILVEADAVWLGLVHNTEGRGPAGGLVRWDRKTGDTKRVAIPAAITVIRRFGGLLYLGTADGLFIVDGSTTTHVRVIPERGGGLRTTLAPR